MEYQADEASVETLEVLIMLAANFVRQSTRYKIKGFIADRANEFETLTASNSTFDLHRVQISRALSTVKSGPNKQTERMRFPVIRTEILPRLGSLDNLQWEWESACHDVESLRALGIKEEKTVSALEDWRQILWDLKTRDEEDHIFGCYLLRQCFLAQEDRRELAQRMLGKKIEVIKVIKETAEFLYAEVKEAALAAAARKRIKSSDAPLDVEPSQMGQYVFRWVKSETDPKADSRWEIIYEGKRFTLKDYRGIFHIVCLLRKPTEKISVFELDKMQLGREMRSKTGTVKQANSDEPKESMFDGYNQSGIDAGKVFDHEGLEKLASEIESLQDELAEAVANNDQAKTEKIHEELHKLVEAKLKAKKPGGGDVYLGDITKNIRDRVCNAINRAMGKIRAESKPLHEHLRSLETPSNWCCYDPKQTVPWEF